MAGHEHKDLPVHSGLLCCLEITALKTNMDPENHWSLEENDWTQGAKTGPSEFDRSMFILSDVAQTRRRFRSLLGLAHRTYIENIHTPYIGAKGIATNGAKGIATNGAPGLTTSNNKATNGARTLLGIFVG